jgi:hypothetical protein
MTRKATTRKLARRGEHTLLPIVDDELVEIRLGTRCLPSLIFRAEDGSEAELTFEDCITLGRSEGECILRGSKAGTTFNPKELGPLLELLGAKVIDATAEKSGSLRIVFSNSMELRVIPSTGGYEAWHFQYPRPGRPFASNAVRILALTGADGRLI